MTVEISGHDPDKASEIQAAAERGMALCRLVASATG